ncbi:AAA family ATPase [Burkholderia gladioli]|uniref:AAA family ATPase n=1 Tax=Burkholderia gladioli TaxID=28095 RepID=UPI00191793ED|nr:AAA family ATPase [Burkholderia gladioli]
MSDQTPPDNDVAAPKASANLRRISLRSLFLDPNNFRIIHEPDQKTVTDVEVKSRDVMQRTMRLLCGDKNQNIQDLIESFKANGYLRVDQILIRELPGGGFLVVEGNRRVAALKFLQQEHESKGIDLGQLQPEVFSQVPVVLYTDVDEVHQLTLMALKHISGNKKWGEWNQAQLLESLHKDYKLTEDEICKRIGITKVEVRRSLRALSLVAEYRASDYGDQFNESMFPIFRHAVRSAALKNWMEWDDGDRHTHNTANRDFFFSLMSREPTEETEDDGSVGYGGKYLEPVITRRDDVDTLAKVIDDERALAYLKQNRDLNGAYRTSDLVFRERQQTAVRSVTADVETLTQLAINPQNLPELEAVRGKLQSIIDRARASGLSGVEQKAVFRDRVDSHFSRVHVQRYRRLAGVDMAQLARINLIAGINNSGKTSLLEAIYLLARQNDLDGLLDVMRRRGKVATDQLDPEWMLEQLGNETLCIDGTYDQTRAAVSIRQCLEEDSAIERTRYLGSIEIESSFGSTELTSLNRIYKGQDRETHADSIRLLCPVIFSSPFFFNEPHRYTSLYHKSVQSKALPDIFEFLRENLLPTLEDIRLTDERQRFLVVDRQFSSGVDLSCYGEGLQRMFLLSLLFASAQHGVVLIDEFENAIHYRLIAPFSRFVHQMAKKFNVQVFITSHSKECVDAFIAAIPEVEDLSCHAIVNTAEGIRTRDFSGPAFKKLLEAGDVDLRGAQ